MKSHRLAIAQHSNEEPDGMPSTGEAASVHKALGKKLRLHRMQAGLSLTEVAERSGFGKAYLSRIEHGSKVPPIATLARIASALGLEPATLLAESGSPVLQPTDWRGVSVVRRDEQRPTVLGGTAFGYNYLSVGDSSPGRALQAFVFSFPEEIDKYVFFEHDGEELLHILTGRLEWQVGMDKFILEAGDTIHFDSRIPHRGRSLEGPATAFAVMFATTRDSSDLA
jgi:transcriptional regulator with XRE-family HTH domain